MGSRLLIFLLLGLLVGLGLYLNSGVFHKKLADLKGHAIVCIDGVKYIQFSSGASVKYAKTGLPELCD